MCLLEPISSLVYAFDFVTYLTLSVACGHGLTSSLMYAFDFVTYLTFGVVCELRAYLIRRVVTSNGRAWVVLAIGSVQYPQWYIQKPIITGIC